MSLPKAPKLVAAIMRGRSTHEDNIVRGVLDYHNQVGNWRLITMYDRPFVSFADVDLTLADGMVGNFCEQHMVDALAAHGIATVNTSSRFEKLPLPRVGTDDEAAGRLGAEHLLERAFPHFGFVDFSHSSWSPVLM